MWHGNDAQSSSHRTDLFMSDSYGDYKPGPRRHAEAMMTVRTLFFTYISSFDVFFLHTTRTLHRYAIVIMATMLCLVLKIQQ